MAKQLMKGNEAIAEAAIRAGVEAYFGYPITPQTELLEYMARRMPEIGRVFLQAESEVAAINMVYGAACAGRRAMTSSSSPGISLMQEGLSYIAASDVPVVIVDVMRGGPGLGTIAPGQSDYYQMVKMAGHGDYRPIVLAPATVQEAVDLTVLAFDLAWKYRTICTVLLDGVLGQMMEPVELPPMQPLPSKPPEWAVTGALGRPKNTIYSFRLQAEELEKLNQRLQLKIGEAAAREVRFKEYLADDADLIVVGFGTAGRVAHSAVKAAREKGIRAGLLRPITLSPFPTQRLVPTGRPGARFPGRGDERGANAGRCAARRGRACAGPVLRANGWHGADDGRGARRHREVEPGDRAVGDSRSLAESRRRGSVRPASGRGTDGQRGGLQW